MTNGPTLPPQAYTRENLTAAFNWLQSQPESVRRLATTPDALVGLFMRAQRFGASSLEADAPVSSQNFMSDLKNLAEGLKQFEEPKRPQPAQAASTGHYGSPQTAAQSRAQGVAYGASANPLPPQSHPAQPLAATYASSPTQMPTMPLPSTLAPGELALGGSLNERTQAMIHEVKTSLNLSSNAEAINMMVSLGYKHLKDLLA